MRSNIYSASPDQENNRSVKWGDDVSGPNTKTNGRRRLGVGDVPDNNGGGKAGKSMTPGKRMMKRLDRDAGKAVGSTSDAVFDYHFENTPFSKKKSSQHHRARTEGGIGNHRSSKGQPSSSIATLAAADAVEGSFTVGLNSTAEIANIYAMSTDPNLSMMSTASQSTANSSEGGDPMNCTTLSDTHELSTSNFIMNTKMREVLMQRSKAMFKQANGERERQRQGEKDIGSAQAAKQSSSTAEHSLSPTMTLPDLTLNLTDTMNVPNNKDNEMIEFTSHQKSRTPRKSDISLLNSTSDDTKSAGGLDSMLADFDDAAEVHRSSQEENVSNSSASAPSLRVNEDESILGGTTTSFVESTASQNHLNDILGVDDDSVNNPPPADSRQEKTASEATKTPATPSADSDPPKATDSSINSLCPSPSFISGKKSKGSGVSDVRRSLGGDVTKIRQLTASLRKNKKASRMSLPALSNLGGHGQNLAIAKVRHSVGVTGGEAVPQTKATLSRDCEMVGSPEQRSVDRNKVDSPARNTRRSKKSQSSTVDSPARNTRQSKKSPLRSPPLQADSPARNTRRSKKSPLGSPAMDSPARNTRSSKRSSSSAESPFNPDDAGGTKRGTTQPSQGEPPKKRASFSPGESELSTTTSLSKEYPFLSIEPATKPASAQNKDVAKSRESLSYSVTAEGGTATMLGFDALMQDVQKDVGGQNPQRDSSLDEDSSEITFSSRHARSKRRQTADTADLMGILDMSQETVDSTNEHKGPHTPRATAAPSAKTPKSILRHNSDDKLNKSVDFGSPEAAEYNTNSPSVSMTPMNPNSVRERYQIPSGDYEESIAGEDTETSMDMEPTATLTLEDGMEQVLAKGSKMTTIEEGSKDVSGSSGPSFFGEQTAELETNVMSLIQPTEDTAFSLPSLSSVSSVSNRESLTRSLNRSNESEDMSIVEPTKTMQLEGTVASLLNGGQGNSFPQEDSKTMDLEGTLASLLDQRDEKEADDETLPSISSHLKRSEGKEEPQTVNIEGTMASLLEGAAGGSSTNPIESIGHMPQSDDTVSELGMNTASHELRTVREVRREPPLQTIVDTPPEPVNLKLEELIDFRDIGLKLESQTEDDVFIQALDLASAASYRPILGASERILSSICEEIEGQCSSDDFESEFEAATKANEGPMRNLQARVRNKSDHEIRQQIELLTQLSSENEVFSNWQPWLSQVVEVYHNELEGCLGEVQNEKTEISEKSASIDQNREQVALPMLIESARQETRKNYKRTKGEVTSNIEDLSRIEVEMNEIETQLQSLQTAQADINKIETSNDQCMTLLVGQKDKSQDADTSYFKFFSVERLHNWVVTSSGDSSISVAFRGVSAETSIQLSFEISEKSAVTVKAKFGRLPSTASSFVSMSGSTTQSRYHPAVSSFLTSKMELLCQDIKRGSSSLSPTEISSTIHFAELRVARVEEAAKEINAALGQCRNSYLQPSAKLKDCFDFTAFLIPRTKGPSESEEGRLNVTLTIPDCYPLVPIEISLKSTVKSFNVGGMVRSLRQEVKPGYGAITRAIQRMKEMIQ